jgi:hypothetical protein
MKARRLMYLNFAVIALLIFITIYQYNRIADFEIQLGHDFQSTVRGSIFLLESDGDPNIWIKNMQQKEGEFALASHIGELTILSRQYYMMNGKISMIGEMLDSLAEEYHQLALNIKNDLDYTQNIEHINKKIDFLVTLLNNVDSISGENERRYYREFIDSESKTSNLVWKEYKKYEKK